ncbi:MAG: response regulator [Nitrospirae bacterium]|nr:response regulator [Nitrospirota bacterium]MBF0534658.1 response regulator [Nitrospirota bacterium]MBF0616298.1 response regulator [Nitrospirota bacterium]
MRKSILIVEDEYIIAADLKMTVMSLGYAVAGMANNGQDAVAIVKTTPIDVVLMDIMLSGELSGIDAAKEIYSNYGIPVIFVTAYTGNDIIEKAIETEPFGYLIKPYTDKELYSAIEIALDKYEKIKQLTKINKWYENNYTSY